MFAARLKQQHPEHKMSLRTFYRCIPSHIISAHRQKYRQCLCEVCQNIDLKLDTLNKLLEDAIDGWDVASEMTLYKEYTLQCLDRTCPSCGVDKFAEEIQRHLTCNNSTIVKWRSWDYVQHEKVKRKELVSPEDSLHSMVCLLKKEMKPFSKHLFVFRWHYMQLKKLLTNLPQNTSVFICDFAENFLCKYQNKVQLAQLG